MQPTDSSPRGAFDGVPVLRSVGGRSFLLLTGLLVVVMAGAVAVIGARDYAHETDLLRERSAAQARFLASVGPEPIFFRDFLRLETLARNAIDDPSTVHVVFLDNDGRSMTRSIDSDDPAVLDAVDRLDAFDSAAIADLLVAGSELREVSQPVISEGVRLGEVRLVYSLEPAQENTRRFMFDASIAALIVLALVLVTTLIVFRRKVRHPLRDLTIKTQALADGRFDDEFDVRRRDEIGVLQQAFNEMASELRETVVGLERAKDDAERADRVKTEFLANMSHEIRTPLNAVLGLSDLLLDSNLTDDQRELVVTMHRSGDALLEMLNEILDYSKLEHGRLELDVEPFDLGELVESTAELFGAVVGEKQITLETHVDEELPRFVAGDEGRVRQVLVNLVGNAVKFTDQGGVRVSVTAAGGDRVVFTVEDSGIGLDPAEVDALFEPFRQADSTTTRVFGGTGLGLAISQSLVDMMGGSIRATGEVGVGATFSFEVPLPVSSSPVGPATATAASFDRELGRRHPLRILMAEDNTVNQLVATRLFARLGYTVDVAKDGVEAVSMTLEGDYDLVLMDIQMPRLDGVQAMQRITSLLPPDRRPRIVACTAHALAGDRERYLAAGMDGYLSKPLERSQVAAVVESTPHRSARPAVGAEPVTEVSTVPDSTTPTVDIASVIDRSELAAIFGDDAETLLRELLPVFQSDAVDRLAAISAAVASDDAETLRLEAHALKGGAKAVAITEIGDAAARLEALGAEGATTGADELIASIERNLARVVEVAAHLGAG